MKSYTHCALMCIDSEWHCIIIHDLCLFSTSQLPGCEIASDCYLRHPLPRSCENALFPENHNSEHILQRKWKLWRWLRTDFFPLNCATQKYGLLRNLYSNQLKCLTWSCTVPNQVNHKKLKPQIGLFQKLEAPPPPRRQAYFKLQNLGIPRLKFWP